MGASGMGGSLHRQARPFPHWSSWPGFLSCGEAPASLKPPRHLLRSLPVIGIYTILIFLVVMAALNIYEFGRLD
jgi:hypothetical protein